MKKDLYVRVALLSNFKRNVNLPDAAGIGHGEQEDGRVGISHNVFEAKNFIKKFSYERIGIYSNDDPLVLDELKHQLRKGKAVFIIAYADRQEYELYSREW